MSNSDKKIRYAQIQLLYKQTRIGLLGVVVVSIAACFIFEHVIDQWKLFLWAGAIFFLSLIRGGILYAFQRRVRLTSDIDRWAVLHVIGVVASSLMWVVPFVFLWPSENMVYQLVWPILILPLSAAGVAGYHTWTPSYISFLLITSLPVTLRFFFEGGVLFNMIGLLSLFFITVMLGAGRVMHANSLRTFELSVRNEELNADLKDEISTSEQLNKQLKQEVLERKSAEKYIRKQNDAKDVLLQEVHHRVKNNMQLILSIVGMQLNAAKSKNTIAQLSDVKNRIASMAVVHELLYLMDDLDTISLKEYISRLISSISNSLNTGGIRINIDIEDIAIDASKCISIGMFTNEAVSNAIKHAFKGISKPEISIKAQVDNEKGIILFSVADNGIGIKDYQQGDVARNSLGLRLIEIFSKQLGTNLHVNNNKGTSLSMKLNI